MAGPQILVVGCSIAGPTLASFMLQAPVSRSQIPRITILERAPHVRPEGQNVDIRGAGLTIIRKLGLEAAIRAATTGEKGVQFVDQANRVWAAFPADRTGQLSTPTADIEILRGRLAELCWRRSERISEELRKVSGNGIEYIFGDHLDSLEQHGEKVHVHFAKSNQTRSFDLVIGADGLQSRTRKMAFGPEAENERLKRLGMYGAFFSMPRGKTDTLWRRWFHAPGRRAIMLRPDQQRDRTTAFMYIINNLDHRLEAAATPSCDGVTVQKGLLREHFADSGWESERVINEMMAAKDFYYDMVAQVKMPRWSTGRVVLVGDAAYCASPISGMGTTLALSGAYNLAGALIRHPDDHLAAFAEYEEKMRPVVARAQKLAPGMPLIVNPETTWGIWMLNAIMYLLQCSGLFSMLVRLAGPPAATVPVEDYGFKKCSEDLQ